MDMDNSAGIGCRSRRKGGMGRGGKREEIGTTVIECQLKNLKKNKDALQVMHTEVHTMRNGAGLGVQKS